MKSIAESFGKAGSRTMGHQRGAKRFQAHTKRCEEHGAADCLACDPEIDDPDAEISPEEEAELVAWCNESGEDWDEIALVIEPKPER
jgi:hypothetical protein